MLVQLKFAMLEILAGRPDGCASIDDLWHQWEEAAESQDATGRFSEFEGIDFLQAGLAVLEGDRLRITDNGRLVLRALETIGKQPSTESAHPDPSKSMDDDLIGTEMRMKIRELGLRAPDEIFNEPRQRVEPEATQTEADADLCDKRETAAAQTADQAAESQDHRWLDKLRFLKWDAGPLRTSFRSARQTLKLPSALYSQFAHFSYILRGHVAEGSTDIKTDGRPAGISGAVITALTLIAILVAAGLFVGVNQIKNLKSEITALERQLVLLKMQAANADQQRKKDNAEQTKQLEDQSRFPDATDRRKSPVEDRSTAAALVLSRDEVLLIREYIKLAPFTGPATAAINVGDPVNTATIPLPSALTDKVPKLLGGRFTIRNGSIVIIKRDSHQADAVLTPN
jgi:hypothetical protein